MQLQAFNFFASSAINSYHGLKDIENVDYDDDSNLDIGWRRNENN